jgi:hypothetical protein
VQAKQANGGVCWCEEEDEYCVRCDAATCSAGGEAEGVERYKDGEGGGRKGQGRVKQRWSRAYWPSRADATATLFNSSAGFAVLVLVNAK